MPNGQRCAMNRRMLTDKENLEAHAMDKRTGIYGQVMKKNPSIIDNYTYMQVLMKKRKQQEAESQTEHADFSA